MTTDTHLLHSDLTRHVIGALYDIYNDVGFGYQEKYYQRALEQRLQEKGLSFKREQHQSLKYHGRIIGRYFIDFVVDGRVVVELKVANDFYETHIRQVVGYLKATGLRVGLLAILSPSGVRLKRIIEG